MMECAELAYVFTSNGRYPFWPGRFYLGRDKSGQHVGLALERNVVTVAGSGGGKGVGLIVQNARKWTESLLCLDPKEGENARLSWKAREALGQKVYVIDPFKFTQSIPDRLRASFNPLADIDPSSPTAATQIRNLADGLVVVHDPRHMEWTEGARDILAGLIAYNIQDAPPQFRSLAQVRNMLMQPFGTPQNGGGGSGLYADAMRMMKMQGLGGLARAAGDIIMQAVTGENKQPGQFLNLAKRATKWLDDAVIADCLSRSSFSLRELKQRPTSVFVALHPDYLETHAAFLRLFVQAALNAMTTGGEQGTHCLFLLDEFYALGKIERVQKAAGKLRSYGVHLWPILQNLGQLDELYKVEGRETFFANSDALTFFNCGGDDRALDYISRRIGALTPEEITSGPPEPMPYDPIPQPAPTAFKPIPQPPPKVYTPVGMPTQSLGWFSSELTEQGRIDDQNAMRSAQHTNALGEAAARAANERAMREWQTNNTTAEAAHRAAEDERMRQWHVLNDRERLKHEAQEAARRARHEHAMRQAFQPRLTPYEAERLIAKREGEKVARSMIVFALGGDILNVPLYPFFQEIADAEAARRAAEAWEKEQAALKERKAAQARKAAERAEWLRKNPPPPPPPPPFGRRHSGVPKDFPDVRGFNLWKFDSGVLGYNEIGGGNNFLRLYPVNWIKWRAEDARNRKEHYRAQCQGWKNRRRDRGAKEQDWYLSNHWDAIEKVYRRLVAKMEKNGWWWLLTMHPPSNDYDYTKAFGRFYAPYWETIFTDLEKSHGDKLAMNEKFYLPESLPLPNEAMNNLPNPYREKASA